MRRATIVLAAAALVVVASGQSGIAGGPSPRVEGEWIVYDYSYFDVHTGDLHMMRPDGSEDTDLTGGLAEDTHGELNPEGNTIVFNSADDQLGQSLWFMGIDGSGRVRLIDRYGVDPTWTPDALWVVYAGSNDLRISHRNGMQDGALTSVDGNIIRNPDVSPDGSTVVFEVQTEGTRRLYTVPITGGEASRISGDDNDFDPAWSADGSRIIFATFRADSGGNIWSMKPDGSDQQPLVPSPHNDFHPTMSPDGARVMFESVRSDSNSFALTIFDTRDGTTTDVQTSTPIPGPSPRRPAWTLVTIDPQAGGQATTTTTAEPPTTTTTSTTVLSAPAETPASGSSPDWLVLGLSGAILLLFGIGVGVMIGGRLRSDPPAPPPPPPLDHD
jgi:TolB protein